MKTGVGLMIGGSIVWIDFPMPSKLHCASDVAPLLRFTDYILLRSVRWWETSSQKGDLPRGSLVYLVKSRKYFQWQLACFGCAHAERHPLRRPRASPAPGLCLYSDHFDWARYRRQLLNLRLH